eukprot:scaffold2621_cov31-Tisochrysis_lutea.AAC.3
MHMRELARHGQVPNADWVDRASPPARKGTGAGSLARGRLSWLEVARLANAQLRGRPCRRGHAGRRPARARQAPRSARPTRGRDRRRLVRFAPRSAHRRSVARA